MIRKNLFPSHQEVSELYGTLGSYRKVATKLRVPLSRVYRILKKRSQSPSPRKLGRPKVLSERFKRQIARYTKSNPQFAPKDMISDLQLPVSYSTLLRNLKSTGFTPKKIQKVPYIKESTKQKRLSFVADRLVRPQPISSYIFSDEKRFCLESVFDNERIWCPSTESDSIYSINKRPLQKNYDKQSIMVWGAISIRGGLHIEVCNKTLNTDGYIDLLSKNFLNKANELFGKNSWTLVQDNAPCHKSKKMMAWFERSKTKVLNIPPNSPDLNLIENFWAAMALLVYKRKNDTPTKKNSKDLCFPPLIRFQKNMFQNSTTHGIID